MRFLFVMDPPHTVRVDEDTTFALMLEAQRRGHRVYHCLVQDLFIDQGRPAARMRSTFLERNPERPLTLHEAEDTPLADLDAVFVRKDPPFDDGYLWATQILEHARFSTRIVNDPRGLRDANEKLYACHFPELMPETLVTNDKQRIREFVEAVGGNAVIKPLDGAGGEGVLALSSGDWNFNAIIEATTRHGRRVALVQRMLPEVVHGDKRILLLDGEPLGAILRVPQGGELRSNIHVGGQVQHSDLDERDMRIVKTIAPRLREDGLWFVGLDVIGGYLTEVNVTSPTGIQQMSRLQGEPLEARVIDALEALAK